MIDDICWTFLYRALEIILPSRIRFIHFNFHLVEKFEYVQTFQLTEINFRFIENVNFPVISVIPALKLFIQKLNFSKLVPKLKYC